jgi:hypothetical protein
MFRNLTTFLFLFLPVCLFAQFTDDFSDGDFSLNPTWSGNLERFIVENQVLRLNDNQAGQAFLATQSSAINNAQWEFWIRLAFTPSNNNHPRIYLVSDSDDLSGPLNGYYLSIGKDGTDNKRLYFYRQTGDTSVEIMAGADNIASASNNIIRIKVTRDELGNWEFFTDPSGGISFVEQGSVSDTDHTSTQWFGVLCRYTVSNATRFYFDEFYVGEILVDTIPPGITRIFVTSENSLEVSFSEPVESQSAQNPENYMVDKGIGTPQSIVFAPESPDKVVLTFNGIFESGEMYDLSIANLQDHAGNVMDDFTGSFTWYVPVRFDVVFNELLADPAPAVGLPEFEYIELYNTSAFDVNLQGWTIQHGTTQRVIPPAEIPSGGYLVLCPPAAIGELSGFGNVVAVPGLSTTALLNAGTTLLLYDDQMEMISWVIYTDQWYRDPERSSGGWSLEKIDPYNFCGEESNWIASNSPTGGTPGSPNSVMSANPDTTPPQLLGVTIENSIEISLRFNETMDEASLLDPANYFINKGIGKPIAVSASEPDFKLVKLILPVPLVDDGIYEIVLSEEITDCAGNSLLLNRSEFTTYRPKRFDIVFNELMANPTPVIGLPPHKYIEFYNTSDFPVNLEGWTLTHGTTERELPFISLKPKGYAVITTESGLVDLQQFGNVYAVPGLSVNFLTIGGLTLTLSNPEGELISWVNYNESWYGDPSKSGGGWSLEKIDPYNFCTGAANWKASRNERGGTPGEANSVFGNNPDLKQPVLLRAGWEANDRTSLFFDEPMDEGELLDPLNYQISNGVGNPESVMVFAPELKRVDLILSTPLAESTLHEVYVAQNVTDCAGNPLARNMARVAVPVAPDSLDLVINEVLFNPPDQGVRYIEIYNRSTRVIDLQNLIISSRDTINNVLTTIRDISNESHLVFPGDYRVLTPDPDIVKNHYMTNNPLGFIQTPMPSMTNSRGVLVLATKGQRTIDQFIYSEDMHYALLTDKKGVALERLNYHRPTQDRSNWHSAAQNVGFGTPGYKNSQFTLDQGSQDNIIEIYPEIFSPDNDGIDDVLNISYKFDKPGHTANINIYDSRGRLVKILKRGELLSTQGVVTWDGTNKNNLKAPIGIYIIFIETFNPSGVVKTYRKTAVLGGKL